MIYQDCIHFDFVCIHTSIQLQQIHICVCVYSSSLSRFVHWIGNFEQKCIFKPSSRQTLLLLLLFLIYIHTHRHTRKPTCCAPIPTSFMLYSVFHIQYNDIKTNLPTFPFRLAYIPVPTHTHIQKPSLKIIESSLCTNITNVAAFVTTHIDPAPVYICMHTHTQWHILVAWRYKSFSQTQINICVRVYTHTYTHTKKNSIRSLIMLLHTHMCRIATWKRSWLYEC